MIVAFYSAAGLAAIAFVASGVLKIVRPKPALKAAGLTWVDDFSFANVKLIGVAEVLGSAGLVLPVLTGIAPFLTPVAGLALTLLMIGAIVVDARHRLTIVPSLVLAVLSLVAAILGIVVI